MDSGDIGVGRTAHPKNFQRRVGVSRDVTTDLELVPSLSRHRQFPPLLALCSMNLGLLPLHDFTASFLFKCPKEFEFPFIEKVVLYPL